MDLLEIVKRKVYRNLRIEINSLEYITNGIVFIYPSWSIDLRNLINLLDFMAINKIENTIYIFDIVCETCRTFENGYNILSNGKGEVYLIIDSKIAFEIIEHDRKAPEKKFEEMIKYII